MYYLSLSFIIIDVEKYFKAGSMFNRLCKYLLLLFIYFFNCGFIFDNDRNIPVAVSYQPNVDRLERSFKQKVNLDEGVIFTKVPRGLVISFDEAIFFSPGDARIKENSLYILDVLASGLRNIHNDCVVEDHTQENMDAVSTYHYGWEISIARAGNIAQYLINCGCINSNRIFALGYGEFMPFKDNVDEHVGMDNRIDIVILEYEANR